MVESVSIVGITIKAIHYLILGKYQRWHITMVEFATPNILSPLKGAEGVAEDAKM